MVTTPLCRLLSIEHPLVSAPLGPDLSGVELVAAVSGAGGLGILQAQLDSPDMLRNKIRRIREMTGNKPFGVNFLLVFPSEEGLALCLEEKVPVISFFWGDPAPYVSQVHSSGAKVFHQVGSLEAAAKAAEAGVDVIVAQGGEAGGHVEGDVATMVLVPRIVDALPSVPVVAAGGIADARGLVAALSLGADGVAMGTRFLASVEARAHPHYKDRLLGATEQDTVRTVLFGRDWPNAPHRVIRTPFVEQWRHHAGHPAVDDETLIGTTRVAGQEIPLPRFASMPPNLEARGDIDAMSLLAGQGVGLIHEIKPAAAIVREIMEEAREIIESRLARFVTSRTASEG
jgi:nitronate monooxygenase